MKNFPLYVECIQLLIQYCFVRKCEIIGINDAMVGNFNLFFLLSSVNIHQVFPVIPNFSKTADHYDEVLDELGQSGHLFFLISPMYLNFMTWSVAVFAVECIKAHCVCQPRSHCVIWVILKQVQAKTHQPLSWPDGPKDERQGLVHGAVAMSLLVRRDVFDCFAGDVAVQEGFLWEPEDGKLGNLSRKAV